MRKVFWSGVFVFLITALVLGADIYFEIWTRSFSVDIVEHLLGGVLAGLIGVWWALALTGRSSLGSALIGALVLGALVELVEYAFGVGISVHMSRSLDTFKDMIVDLIGGWIAWKGAQRML